MLYPTRYILSVIMSLFLSIMVSDTMAQSKVDIGTIMLLGDSITYGGSGTNAGYRGPLYNMLSSANMTFHFVGDSTLNPGSLPTEQIHHAGHSSYASYDLNNNLNGLDTRVYDMFGGADRNPNGGYWVTGGHDTGREAITPEFVLLLVGANDLYFNQDASASANLNDLLTNLTNLLPNADILIAYIPPSTLYGTRVNTFNDAIHSVAPGYDNVTIVDMNTAFPANGLSNDGVHPNDVGYEWMAEQWNNTIMATVPEPTTIGLLLIGGLLGYRRK